MAEPIRYIVDLTDRVQHLVRVTLWVPADLAGGARIVLPVWTPGSYVVRDYVRTVQSITASEPGGGRGGTELELAVDGRTAWRLPDHLDAEVAVTLELYANDLTVRTSHVDDHHALLIPAATFPYVEGAETRPHVVSLPTPPGQRVFSLLPDDGQGDYLADDRDHLVDSAFEVGDLPSVDYEVAGVAHTFVWAGHGGRPDLQRVARDAQAIGESAVELFAGELPIEAYTTLCAGWDQGGGGLEHRDGAVLQIPVRVFQDPELYAKFQSLLAHEYLHLYNVKRLTPAALVRPDFTGPTHTESLWVAEGWTAYYDELLPTRAGLWTSRRLLDSLRDGWQRVLDTPGADRQPLRRASHEAWTKHYVRDENTPNVTTDYYAHGALVAFELDLRLRALDPAGAGLDAVLRLLWQRHARTDEGYTETDVLDAIAAVGDDELAALVDQRVGKAGPPHLEDALDAVGLRSVDTEGPTPPDLGVRATDDEHGVALTSVLRDRPAWRAGLTGGDRLVAIDGLTVARGELDRALLVHGPGETVEVAVTRGPRLLTLPVTLGDPRPRPRLVAVDDPSPAQRQAFSTWCGRDLADLDA